MARKVLIRIVRGTESSLSDFATNPLGIGELGLATDSLVLFIGTGGSNHRITMSAGNHKALDQLVHNLAEPCYTEYNYSGNLITNIITYTNAGKTIKIREEVFTYLGNKVSAVALKQYNGAGVVIVTLTTTYTYTGNKLTSEVVTII